MGKNFSRFKLFKFRTMVVGAEKKGPLITKSSDPRITKIGAFLRKRKLDELPQMFNVLMGDMSIVGPRPQTERYALHFRDQYEEILTIRPGITSNAALEYKNEQEVLNHYTDIEEGHIKEILPAKLNLYKKYMQEICFVTDLKIIFKTITSLLF